MTLRERCYRIACRIFRREIIRDGFQGILGRDPEDEALRSYERSFAGLGVKGVISDLTESAESWEKQKTAHARELIREAYDGVLGRNPDENGLKGYEGRFKEIGIRGVIKNIFTSKEAWEKIQIINSDKLVTELYSGLFGRFPDQNGLNEHKSAIERDKSLIPTLNRLSNSNELKEKLNVVSRYSLNEIVEGLEKALFEKDVRIYPNQEICVALEYSSSIADAVQKIKKTDRFQHAKKIASLIPEDLEDRIREKLVFLHIDKTAGTTIHEEFKRIYGHDKVLLKHEDPLFKYSVDDLDTYRVIGGHFNYDSIRYSGLDRSRIFTFFRDPLRRFESLYNFWRSHDKSHPNYVVFHELADTLSAEELCMNPDVKESRLSWNHMTWAVMGQTIWNQWRIELQRLQDADERRQYIEREVRPRMNRRLQNFYFIGEQETFDQSMNTLLTKLGLHPKKIFTRHNDTMANQTIKEGFKKDFKKINFSESTLEKVSASLLELDFLLYSIFNNSKVHVR
jgi:hypothetical protein